MEVGHFFSKIAKANWKNLFISIVNFEMYSGWTTSHHSSKNYFYLSGESTQTCYISQIGSQQSYEWPTLRTTLHMMTLMVLTNMKLFLRKNLNWIPGKSRLYGMESLFLAWKYKWNIIVLLGKWWWMRSIMQTWRTTTNYVELSK